MADMTSQGRSPILEKLLSDGGNDTIAATNWDKNPEGGQNPLEFSCQFPGMNIETPCSNRTNNQSFACETISTEMLPYFDLTKDSLTQTSDIWTQSNVGQNSLHYFNPGILWCSEDADFHPVSSLPAETAEANVAGMSNLLSRIQQPSPFTMVPQQVITDVYSPVDANSIIENNSSWENPSYATSQHFYNPQTSSRLRHFTSPFNHLPYQQNDVYTNFSSDLNNQLYHYAPTDRSDAISTPYFDYMSTLTDTIDYYNQPQMQVPRAMCNENVPNFYQFNFVQQCFLSQCQVVESHANSQMYNEIQHANLFQTSNYLYSSNDSNQHQLSDICVNPCASNPHAWTILNSDTTPRSQEISENSMYRCLSETKPLTHQPFITIKEPSKKSSCIYESDIKTSVPKFSEKLELVETKTEKQPAYVIKEASLLEQVKAQVDEFIKSPKKRPDIRKWSCPVCGRTLSRAWTLKIHLRQHSGYRPFKCPSCPKSFTQRSLLNSHRRTHSKERPYSCSRCHKTFAHPSAFKTHARTHTGERPHRCPVPNCGSAFSDISTLSKHARVHSGEKPYVCDVCNRRFTQSGNLNKHRRTVHKVTNRITVMKIPENTKILSEILGNNEDTTSAMI